ncbi:MAG: hypothetical protein AAB893_02885 [Patescibacteria group bacterium]
MMFSTLDLGIGISTIILMLFMIIVLIIVHDYPRDPRQPQRKTPLR